MALLIEKNTTILGNIDVSTLYVRFDLSYKINGSTLEVFTEVFPSQTSYAAGAQGIPVEGIPFNKVFTYDRAVDGSDLLTAAHNKFKDFLSTDTWKTVITTDPSTGDIVYIQEPVLDPSTGLQISDPSTGELLWENGDPSTHQEINIPKFAEDSSISLIDID